MNKRITFILSCLTFFLVGCGEEMFNNISEMKIKLSYLNAFINRTDNLSIKIDNETKTAILNANEKNFLLICKNPNLNYTIAESVYGYDLMKLNNITTFSDLKFKYLDTNMKCVFAIVNYTLNTSQNYDLTNVSLPVIASSYIFTPDIEVYLPFRYDFTYNKFTLGSYFNTTSDIINSIK